MRALRFFFFITKTQLKHVDVPSVSTLLPSLPRQELSLLISIFSNPCVSFLPIPYTILRYAYCIPLGMGRLRGPAPPLSSPVQPKHSRRHHRNRPKRSQLRRRFTRIVYPGHQRENARRLETVPAHAQRSPFSPVRLRRTGSDLGYGDWR